MFALVCLDAIREHQYGIHISSTSDLSHQAELITPAEATTCDLIFCSSELSNLEEEETREQPRVVTPGLR